MVAVAYEKRRSQEIPSTGLWLERFDDLDWASIMGGGRLWKMVAYEIASCN